MQVFLGGSCDPTTWRADIAIPKLEDAGVSFFNPQVKEWTPDCVTRENQAKAKAKYLVFVIDGQTRSLASVSEVTELMLTLGGDRHLLLVIEDIKDGTVIDGQTVTGRELKDLNRQRTYLRDLVKRNPHRANVYLEEEGATPDQRVVNLTDHLVKIAR